MADEGRPSRRGKEGLFGYLAFYVRYLGALLRFRWPPRIGLSRGIAAPLAILIPQMGTEIFPTSTSLLRIRLRAPAGTRVEESERQVLQALDIIRRDIGPGNIEITNDFVGVVPSSYPVNRSTSSPVDLRRR
jgi:multidrug efflux pump subunit AcrB